MNIEVFKSEDFGEVRVITKDNEPWFLAKDISEKLEYSEISVMLRRLDDDETAKIEPTEIVDTNNMAGEIATITKAD
ncbi:BRO-N domain-containing protein [Clostridium sp. UBA7339]|uniref:BRO-N domain-containing protein n=1 Tax=Clostridium sp. UBA7339 TaxID=1946376 RepID=UPI003216AA1E